MSGGGPVTVRSAAETITGEGEVQRTGEERKSVGERARR